MKSITSFFKKSLKPFSRGTRELEIRPVRDWKILVITFSVLAVIAIAGNLYLYVQISAGEIFLTPQKQSVSHDSISKSTLDDTIEYYQSKMERQKAVGDVKLRFTDPSN